MSRWCCGCFLQSKDEEDTDENINILSFTPGEMKSEKDVSSCYRFVCIEHTLSNILNMTHHFGE